MTGFIDMLKCSDSAGLMGCAGLSLTASLALTGPSSRYLFALLLLCGLGAALNKYKGNIFFTNPRSTHILDFPSSQEVPKDLPTPETESSKWTKTTAALKISPRSEILIGSSRHSQSNEDIFSIAQENLQKIVDAPVTSRTTTQQESKETKPITPPPLSSAETIEPFFGSRAKVPLPGLTSDQENKNPISSTSAHLIKRPLNFREKQLEKMGVPQEIREETAKLLPNERNNFIQLLQHLSSKDAPPELQRAIYKHPEIRSKLYETGVNKNQILNREIVLEAYSKSVEHQQEKAPSRLLQVTQESWANYETFKQQIRDPEFAEFQQALKNPELEAQFLEVGVPDNFLHARKQLIELSPEIQTEEAKKADWDCGIEIDESIQPLAQRALASS